MNWKRRTFPCAMIALVMFAVPAQGGARGVSRDGLWRMVPAAPAAQRNAQPWVRPNKFQGVFLEQTVLTRELARAPMGFTRAAAPVVIELPLPDGTFASFAVVESRIMAPALAARFPEIKTYAGIRVGDPSTRVHLDLTPAGFHAQILSPHGAVYIDPYTKGNTEFYVSYRKIDGAAKGFSCLTQDNVLAAARDGGNTARETGDTLYTYRLAVAATGEYTSFHGGTVAAGLAAVVTAINRVSGIYQVEFAVRFELVPNNDRIIYTNGATDPYTNNSGGTMLGQNQTNLNSVIGTANYDVGHVFSTGGGGVASLRVTCTSGKARGVTGQSAPIGDAFYVDFVAHEIGHQFGGNHTFNGINGNCSGGNRHGSTAYEPGSGSTIMAYAGICGGSDNLQPHSDPYFHSESLREIDNWVAGTGGNCAVTTATGNTAPIVDAGPDYTIPMGTPFTLTGSATDAENSRLSYCWEERDLGPGQTALGMVDNGDSPLFRSFNPTADPSRTFPQWSDILTNTTTIGEVLPSTSRFLNLRLVVRDDRLGGGGVDWADMQVTVDGTRGPFEVTFPNSAVTLAGAETITWDVAGTNGGGIGVTEVNILLSTDGGSTFPEVLAMNTPNDGSETVSMPSLETTAGRIKIEAVDNVFFDVSDTDFVVEFSGAPLLAGFPHEKLKNRYLSFEPANGAEEVAFDIALADGPGDTGALGWIGEPYDAGCEDENGVPNGEPCTQDYLARVVSDPVFRVWPEPVVHVGDCRIVPAAAYEMRSSADAVKFSSALTITTALAPTPQFWADSVGELLFGIEWTGPNGVVNFNDITATIQTFQEILVAPHVSRVDLVPETPNYLVNFADISMVVKGFQGEAYPFSTPADCP